MYADSYTIIYWYKKVESGIIVKHIEINEKDKKQGLTLESGIELDENVYTGGVDDTKETSRNTYTNYISVNGPTSDDENMIIVGKDEDSKQVTFKQDDNNKKAYQRKLLTGAKDFAKRLISK